MFLSFHEVHLLYLCRYTRTTPSLSYSEKPSKSRGDRKRSRSRTKVSKKEENKQKVKIYLDYLDEVEDDSKLEKKTEINSALHRSQRSSTPRMPYPHQPPLHMRPPFARFPSPSPRQFHPRYRSHTPPQMQFRHRMEGQQRFR